MENFKIIEKRLKIASRLFSFIPFIRFAALTGSFVLGRGTKESDIDIFLIAKKERLFTSRFFCHLVFGLLLLRAKGKKRSLRFCFNYWLSSDHLKLFLPKKETAFEYSKMVSLYDEEGFYEKILRENPSLKQNFKSEPSFKFSPIRTSFFLKPIFEKLSPQFLEPFLKWVQILWLQNKIKNKSRLYFSDKELRIFF